MIKLLRIPEVILWIFNFFRVDFMAKKISYRGHGGHRELLSSLCPLYSWWFSEPISEDNKKTIKSILFFLIERTGSQSGDQSTCPGSYDFGENR